MIDATLMLRVQLALLATLAILFVVIPGLTIKSLGLPPSPSPFWPRLLGGVFLGMIFATLASELNWTSSGLRLGLGGYVAINLTVAFTLMSCLVAGAAMPTRRGRLFLWLLAVVFALLGFIQISIAT